MNKTMLIFLLSTLFMACQPIEEEEDTGTIYTACSVAAELSGTCERYMNRDIYFAYSDGDRNNVFHKQKVQDALQVLSENTDLGENYFTFHEVDESLLDVEVDLHQSETEFKSFVQIWPDDEFNALYAAFGALPDYNAITVVNAANKRQFYIILRASCFESSDILCTNDSGATFTSNAGLQALVSRQLGLLVGLLTKDCSLYPDHVMCAAFPHDGQWSTVEKDRLFSTFNNGLETISNNPSFYSWHTLD